MRVVAALALAAMCVAGASAAESTPKTYVLAEITEDLEAWQPHAAFPQPAMMEEAAQAYPYPAAGYHYQAQAAMPRFAAAGTVPTPASGPYGQYGYPYSAFPPIPPPMPTYLPPPPYTPQPLTGNLINNQIGQVMQQDVIQE